MVDSTADFRVCSSEFHLSLAVVFVLRPDIDSNTKSRTCLKKRSLANNSVLHRMRFDENISSIVPQILKIRFCQVWRSAVGDAPVYDQDSIIRLVIRLSADEEIDHVVNGYYVTSLLCKWKVIEPAEEQVFPQHT